MGTPAGSETDVDRRLTTLVRVAELHGTAVDLDLVPDLLPDHGPRTAEAVADWIDRRGSPDLVVEDRSVRSVRAAVDPERRRQRRDRAELYWTEANRLFDGPLRPVRSMVRCAGVTGSAAYLEPMEGDDIDLMVIPRAGEMWLFLALVFGTVRFRPGTHPHGGSHWCFNYVMDEREAARAYGRPAGFLFAREALSTRILRGEPFYRGLLGRATWMRGELPRLYAHRLPEPTGPAPVAAAPWATRVANAIVFPLLATYLQLVGLVRNARLRRSGRSAEQFRTVTRFRRYTLETAKFDGLLAEYAATRSPATPAEGGTA